MTPSLADPVKAVRIEAARQLAELPDKGFDADQKARFDDTLAEYRKAMAYSGDFSFGRFNLANLEASLGQTDAAVDHYLAAIRIDNAPLQALGDGHPAVARGRGLVVTDTYPDRRGVQSLVVFDPLWV